MPFKDLFTGGAQRRAESTNRGIQSQFFDDNRSTLRTGVDRAQNFSRGGTADAISELTGARDHAIGTFRAGEGDSLDFINQGVRGAQGALGNARGEFRNAGSVFDRLAGISNQFEPATETLLDSLGLRGAEGNERATDVFSNSLRNTFEFDQGIDAINRRNAAVSGGSVVGGNVDRDAQIFGQNLANSKTDSFLDRLLGLTDRRLGAEGTVAGGRERSANNIAGTFQQEADLLNRGGQNRAQIASDTAARIAALTSGTGSQVAGLQQGLGTRLGNTELDAARQEISLRDILGSRLGASLGRGADASTQGASNTLSALLQGGNLISSGIGRFRGASAGGAT